MVQIAQTTTDILILGSGGAGLFAALHAHKADPELSITVAVKGLLGKCGCTRMVQGGYNVALAKEDSVERHFMDTIHGGTKPCSGAVIASSNSRNDWACSPRSKSQAPAIRSRLFRLFCTSALTKRRV